MLISELIDRVEGLEAVSGDLGAVNVARVEALGPDSLPTPGALYLCNDLTLIQAWLNQHQGYDQGHVALVGPGIVQDFKLPATPIAILAYRDNPLPLDLGARILRVLLERSRPLEIDQELLQRELLEQVLEEQVHLTRSVLNRASSMGMEIASKTQVLLVTIENPDVLYTADTATLKARLVGTVRACLAQDSPHHEVYAQSSGVIALLDKRREKTDEELLAAVGQQVRTLPNLLFSIVLGGQYQTPDAIPKSYREAIIALEVKRQFGLQSPVISYEAARPRIVTYHLSQDPKIREIVEQVLAPLQAVEPRYRRALLQTLKAYLEHHHSVQQASASLHIHPNTLKYRVQRLEDLLNLRSADPEQRFLLLLSAQVGLYLLHSS